MASSVNLVPDTTPPTAALHVRAVTDSWFTPEYLRNAPDLGMGAHIFRIDYADGYGNVDRASLRTDGVTVQPPAPGAAPLAAEFLHVQEPVFASLGAYYRVAAPDGIFDAADNGQYVVNVAADTVRDAAGNSLPAGSAGAFTVHFRAPEAGVATSEIAVAVVQPPAAAGPVDPGARDRIRVRVTNNGPAPYEGYMRVRVRGSADGVLDARDVSLGVVERQRLRLAAGASIDLPVRLRYYPVEGAVPGGVHLIVQADEFDSAPETDERDNVAVLPGRVEIRPDVADLAVSRVAGARLVPGRRASVAVTVSNLGAAAYRSSAQPPTVRLFASPDGAFDPADVTGETLLATLSPKLNVRAGKRRTLRLRFDVPTTFTPGSYHLAVTVDRTDAAGDPDTTNNTAVTVTPVSVE